ncbi:hypothetical protein ACFOW1_09335 [Parasediminibacterium paludis]|uniref:Uncharacterized protein n=1 Tax=Parasediminibacterium paludis TaxID=908966 RepID=A0ABV8PYP3_9BACT
MKKHLLLLTAIIMVGSITATLNAQSVKDSWYGIGVAEVPNETNNYLGELILNEKNGKVTGIFNYYFRDSLFTNKVEGKFDKVSNQLLLTKQNIIFHRSYDTKTGVDCPMYAQMTLRNSRVESVLKGMLYADNEHQFTCPVINFNFKRIKDIAPPPPTPKKQSYTILPKKNKEATVILPRPSSIAIKSDTAVVTKKAPAAIDPKQLLYSNRQKVYTQELDIESSSVRIELYDNGEIDYDSVSLYLNDKLVLGSTMLKHSAITITLPLSDSLEYNELSMFADNLGLIPPNTAALILYDGKIRHEIMMTSDLNRNATIKLRRKKKP